MTDDFIPPIRERTTEELLKIVGSSNKWNSKAVQLAIDELINRKVEPKKIETAKYLSKKREKLQENLKARESYQLCDFIFKPVSTIFVLLFSWELKKDGYLRKAKQQKYFRIVFGIIIFVYILFAHLF